MSIELKQLQDLVYSIFVEFDRICKKHNIHYSMEGGTLMGAVKFGGFVPWDDDIDVVMVRDEYEKFLQIAPKELGSDFFLQSYHNVPEFPLNYAKLCLNGTLIYDYEYSKLKTMHHGVFIDIFPLDHVRPKTWKFHYHLVGILTGARATKLRVHKPTGIRKLIFKTVGLLPTSALVRLTDKICRWYNGKETGYLYEVCNANSRFPAMPAQLYQDTLRLPFCHGTFEAVKDYHAFLQSRFGQDYAATLPPPEERKPSHCQNIRILKGN